MNMGIVVDILFLLVILLGFYFGMKRGFFRSVFDLAATVAALIIATWFSGIVAHGFYYEVLREPMVRQITESLATSSSGNGAEAALSALPELFTGALNFYGVTADTLNSAIANATGSAAEAAVAVMAPVIISVLKSLFSLVIFVILLVILRIVSELLSRIFRLPVLNQLDKGLGSALGLAQGLVIVFLLCFSVQVLSYLFSPEWQQALNDSRVYQFYLYLWD